MESYTDVSAVTRNEYGVEMRVYRKAGGWSEIVAVGDYSDAASVFDHTAFSGATLERELRNALRRHARAVSVGKSIGRTPFDVIVTQYRAEFKAEPFARPRWRISGAWQERETLAHRRLWTVEKDFTASERVSEAIPALRNEQTPWNAGFHPSALRDPNARVLFVADHSGPSPDHTGASRYGTAILLEEIARA